MYYTGTKPCALSKHTQSKALSTASHARTNHCHRALSDRADTWGWGEITETSVGVAFSLLSSFCKKNKSHATLLNICATEIKHTEQLTTICAQTFLFTLALSAPYSLVNLFDQSAMPVM